MGILNFITDLRNSIFSVAEYKTFAHNNLGKTFKYLMLIILVFGGITLLPIVKELVGQFGQFSETFRNSAPDFAVSSAGFEVKDGTPMPIIMKNSGVTYCIIDTTGHSTIDMLKNDSGILITKDEMIMKKNAMETRTYNFSQMGDLVVTKDQAVKWLPYLKLIAVFTVFFGYIYFVLAKLVSGLIWGLVVMFLSRLQKTVLSFNQSFNIAIYAMTLPTILQTVHATFLPDIPYFGWIYNGICLVYLWLGVKAAGKPDASEPPGLSA